MSDIKKAAGVLILERKLLVSRSRGKNLFVAPGGKLEPGETDVQALARELKEELDIEIDEVDLEDLGTFVAAAAGDESKIVSMHVFIVKRWKGEITVSSEIEELRWVSSDIPNDMEIGSIFAHEVIPKLKESDLID